MSSRFELTPCSSCVFTRCTLTTQVSSKQRHLQVEVMELVRGLSINESWVAIAVGENRKFVANILTGKPVSFLWTFDLHHHNQESHMGEMVRALLIFDPRSYVNCFLCNNGDMSLTAAGLLHAKRAGLTDHLSEGLQRPAHSERHPAHRGAAPAEGCRPVRTASGHLHQ